MTYSIEEGGVRGVEKKTGRNLEAERERLVQEHLRFDSGAKRQDLFDLDEGAIEDLARLAPTVDLENKKGLEKIPEGTVVHVQSKAEKKHGGRFENQLGVVYPGDFGTERRVRMLYEVKESKGEGAPERRWNKWEKNPETGAMRCVEIKALTSKKEGRGAVVDVKAEWKLLNGEHTLGEEYRHFTGKRLLMEFTLDKRGEVAKEHTIIEEGKHTIEDVMNIASSTIEHLHIEDGKESRKKLLIGTGADTRTAGAIEDRHKDINWKNGGYLIPRQISFEHPGN